MLGKIKLFAGGLGVIAIVTVAYLGYRQYNSMLSKISHLEQTNTVLKTGLDMQSATVGDLRNATGEWRDSRARLLAHIKEMQEVADEAQLETERLRELFSETDWDSVAADSLANTTVDRLWGSIASATKRGDDRGGEADSTTTADTSVD